MYLLRILVLLLLATTLHAEKSHPDFEITPEWKPRVDFWVDIFSTYTQSQVVFHHRNYPQAVFDVVDYSSYASSYGIESDRYKKTVKKLKEKKIKEINQILRKLAAGTSTNSQLGRRVADAMLIVSGGSEKYNKAVKDDLVRGQTGIKDKFAEAISRSGRYLKSIEKIFVEENNLPIELTRLPFVESSFDYSAYSSVGAAGIWQFMRATAKSYMKVDRLVDERRDVLSATRGAAKYLKSAYKSLKHWPLAVTSYNHGVAGVRKKVTKYGTSSLYELVEETKDYPLAFASANFFPELLAANYVYNNRHKLFPGLEIEEALEITEYRIKNPTSVRHVLSRLGMEQSELEKYNYALSKNVWNGNNRIPSGYSLKVPSAYKYRISRLTAPEPTITSSSVVYGTHHYKVHSGDTLARISRKYRISISDLKKINNLKSDKIKIGQVLTVQSDTDSRDLPSDTKSRIAFSGHYTVRRGDTISSIASKYKIYQTELKRQNNLRSSRIYVGQKLKVPGSSKTKSSSYKVKSGDTLWGISKRYGISISRIRKINNLKSLKLKIGQVLKLK